MMPARVWQCAEPWCEARWIGEPADGFPHDPVPAVDVPLSLGELMVKEPTAGRWISVPVLEAEARARGER